MTTTILATIEDPTAQKERLAIDGFRAGYTTDLRSFVSYCDETGISILEARRTHLELFCRTLETRGLMPSGNSVTRGGPSPLRDRRSRALCPAWCRSGRRCRRAHQG